MEDRRRYTDRRKTGRDQEQNELLYAIFVCGDYRFAIAKEHILAISVQPNVVPMPFSRSWFIGIASIHGYIASVTDLSAYLGLSAACEKDGARVLLLGHDGCHFGLLVDAVQGVMECQPCERSRAFYPLDIEQYMQGQRCADGQCFDQFNVKQLLNEQRFLDAIDRSQLPILSVAPTSVHK
ncbi:MAG: hypothetical protein COC09_04490 [Gammaproteobacteria bacterium]|nr:chemotaxis protein CheW [Gammaproteobacteria bacterium]PCH63849.1 MAG: hypothetical protein COC09_04490 [Gammaproteobacteria bacterium]